MSKQKRFEITYSEGAIKTVGIMVDTHTGVNYLIVTELSTCITPLLDQNGNVVITPITN